MVSRDCRPFKRARCKSSFGTREERGWGKRERKSIRENHKRPVSLEEQTVSYPCPGICFITDANRARFSLSRRCNIKRSRADRRRLCLVARRVGGREPGTICHLSSGGRLGDGHKGMVFKGGHLIGRQARGSEECGHNPHRCLLRNGSPWKQREPSQREGAPLHSWNESAEE